MLALLLLAAWLASEPEETIRLRALAAASPRLPLRRTEFVLRPPLTMEMVSSAATDSQGVVYILQRGKDADPVIVAAPVVILYVFLQRHFIRGMLSGAIKG